MFHKNSSPKLSIIAVIAMAITAFSCRHKTDLTGIKDVSFSTDIQPILAANCTMSGCHNGSGSGGEHEFGLTTYNDVMGIVSADDAHSSKLYEVISNHGLEDIMPPSPNPPLSNDQVKIIYLWIEQGAKNN